MTSVPPVPETYRKSWTTYRLHAFWRLPDRNAILFVTAVWASLSVSALLLPLHYRENSAFVDDFRFIPWLTGNEPVTLSWLWAPHHGHRIPLAKLIFVGLWKVTGGNFRSGGVANVLALAAMTAFLVLSARRLRGRTTITDGVFPLLFLHWGQYATLMNGIALHYVLAVFLASVLLAIVIHQRELLTLPPALLATACLALLPLNGGPGLVFVPPMALWLTYGAIQAWRSAPPMGMVQRGLLLVLPVLGLIPTGLYFLDYEGAGQPHAGWKLTLDVALAFLSASTGMATADYWPWPLYFFGAAMAMCLVLLCLAWRQRPQERLRVAGLSLFLAGITCMAACIGYFRGYLSARLAADRGWMPFWIAFRSDYVTLASLEPCCLYFVAVASRAYLGRLLQLLLFLVLVVAAPSNYQQARSRLAEFRQTWLAFEADVCAGTSSKLLARRNAIALFFGPAETMARLLEMMRTAGCGPFACFGRLPPTPWTEEILETISKRADVIAFCSADQVMLRLDERAGLDSIEPRRDLDIYRGPNSVVMTCHGPDSSAHLPPVSCPAGCDLIVRLDVVAEAHGWLRLVCPLDGHGDYPQEQVVTEEFFKGPNTLYLRIPHCSLSKGIHFQLAMPHGTFALNSVEIRATPATVAAAISDYARLCTARAGS